MAVQHKNSSTGAAAKLLRSRTNGLLFFSSLCVVTMQLLWPVLARAASGGGSNTASSSSSSSAGSTATGDAAAPPPAPPSPAGGRFSTATLNQALSEIETETDHVENNGVRGVEMRTSEAAPSTKTHENVEDPEVISSSVVVATETARDARGSTDEFSSTLVAPSPAPDYTAGFRTRSHAGFLAPRWQSVRVVEEPPKKTSFLQNMEWIKKYGGFEKLQAIGRDLEGAAAEVRHQAPPAGHPSSSSNFSGTPAHDEEHDGAEELALRNNDDPGMTPAGTSSGLMFMAQQLPLVASGPFRTSCIGFPLMRLQAAELSVVEPPDRRPIPFLDNMRFFNQYCYWLKKFQATARRPQLEDATEGHAASAFGGTSREDDRGTNRPPRAPQVQLVPAFRGGAAPPQILSLFPARTAEGPALKIVTVGGNVITRIPYYEWKNTKARHVLDRLSGADSYPAPHDMLASPGTGPQLFTAHGPTPVVRIGTAANRDEKLATLLEKELQQLVQYHQQSASSSADTTTLPPRARTTIDLVFVAGGRKMPFASLLNVLRPKIYGGPYLEERKSANIVHLPSLAQSEMEKLFQHLRKTIASDEGFVPGKLEHDVLAFTHALASSERAFLRGPQPEGTSLEGDYPLLLEHFTHRLRCLNHDADGAVVESPWVQLATPDMSRWLLTEVEKAFALARHQTPRRIQQEYNTFLKYGIPNASVLFWHWWTGRLSARMGPSVTLLARGILIDLSDATSVPFLPDDARETLRTGGVVEMELIYVADGERGEGEPVREIKYRFSIKKDVTSSPDPLAQPQHGSFQIDFDVFPFLCAAVPEQP
ncbi:unnamed protein product [Amoebophrya sp. A120]|nr:unnamed protein product [Amoebophrya sp. A120]|eukprot:GSA120T00019730001.1